ncbi:hypothetical protein DVA86_29160 [Streptomyces armeniacus]|uniref:Uncharacterized protein n=1 Tax=Streptomyces armeniacus TaxID=83291 RepID=A0A345XWP7_9ACTN|nr:hypothetical protein [Streptomyces armeniacus]AXK36063.1 hypothetical protein DVA86_29160 [Streptomyces armeniacus]
MLGVSGAAGLAVLGAAGCQSDDSGSGGKDAGGNKPGEVGSQSGRGESGKREEGPRLADAVLGANFNGDPSKVTFAELEDVSATWLRGFFPMDDADKDSIPGKPQIKMLLDAKERGLGTSLSLKFQYKGEAIPTPGSEAWKTAFARLDKVLPAVMNKIDILVIGNEPFLETREEDRDRRLNKFYEKLARHVVAYRDKHSATGTRLYMGALNHIDWEDGKTAATQRWMDFVKKTKGIDGVDIHPHVSSLAGAQEYIDYVLPRMRPEQKFLATEFSLVLYWQEHMADPVAAGFAEKYPETKGMQVWEVLREATQERFTQEQWSDFFAMTPWLRKQRNYLREQVEMFRKTERLALAGYGVSQDEAMTVEMTAEKKPWMLNSLFCPYTVRDGKDGLPGRNTTWIGQFRELQKKS